MESLSENEDDILQGTEEHEADNDPQALSLRERSHQLDRLTTV